MYKEISGFENYLVNRNGVVYATHLKRKLKPYSNGIGYLQIKLLKNNKRHHKYIHRLVAETFIGESNLDVNHKDGDKTNNNIRNLEFVTKSENSKHAFKNRLLKGCVEKYY